MLHVQCIYAKIGFHGHKNNCQLQWKQNKSL